MCIALPGFQWVQFERIVVIGRLRGERLRDLLNVSADSPLLDRTVRDSFEHVDERLDKWLISQPRWTAEHFESGAVPEPPTGIVTPLRVILPERGVISFGGIDLEIPPLVSELARMLDLVRQAEPATNFEPGLGAALALLQPLPSELRLTGPSRRPDEPVTAGLPPTNLPSLEKALRAAIESLRQSKDERRPAPTPDE